jgi:hypothetical protein
MIYVYAASVASVCLEHARGTDREPVVVAKLSELDDLTGDLVWYMRPLLAMALSRMKQTKFH